MGVFTAEGRLLHRASPHPAQDPCPRAPTNVTACFRVPSPPGMSAVCVWWGPKDLAQLMGPHPDCTWNHLVGRCDVQAPQADQVCSSTV